MTGDVKLLGYASGLAGLAGAAFHYSLGHLPELLAWLAPLAYQVAPKVSWLPAGALEKGVFAVAGVLVVWYGARWLGGLINAVR